VDGMMNISIILKEYCIDLYIMELY